MVKKQNLPETKTVKRVNGKIYCAETLLKIVLLEKRFVVSKMPNDLVAILSRASEDRRYDGKASRRRYADQRTRKIRKDER